MFSGIVEGTGKIKATTNRGAIVKLDIDMPFSPDDISTGDSICVEGVCLTVVGPRNGNTLSFEVIPETLRKTNLGRKTVGSRVNVERSLKVGERIHGHFVFGHVDGVATIKTVKDEGESRQLVFSIPAGLRKFLAQKGSISICGVSLTLGEISSETFCVYLIPHTKELTTLGELVAGDEVNMEVDMLARYILDGSK